MLLMRAREEKTVFGRMATVVVFGVMLSALALVIMVAARTVEHDQSKLLQEFALERLHQMEEAAGEIESDFGRIAKDLHLAQRLVQGAHSPDDRKSALEALVGVVPAYRAVEVRDGTGVPIMTVVSPDDHGDLAVERFAGAFADTAARARAQHDHALVTSARLAHDPSGWLRVFSWYLHESAAEPALVVSLLVDTRPFFSRLKIPAADSSSRLVVLGAHGLPAPLTDERLATAIARLDSGQGAPPRFGAFVKEMRQGERGTMRIPGAEARGLNLGSADLVAAFVPVDAHAEVSWKIAMVASTASLRSHQRVIVRRAVLVVLAVALLLAGLTVYVVRAARRSAILREELRHAGRLAHLREKADKILDTIPTAVAALSEDGRIAALNRALRERLGDDALGRPLSAGLSSAPNPVIKQLVDLVAQAQKTGQPQRILGQPMALFGKEGQYNVHALPLEQAFPDARLLLVIEDLSEIRALETRLLRSEKLATVGVLAAGIAHEIGTPLSVIRGRAEYMQKKLGADDPGRDGLRVIVEQIDQVSRTIRQLLDFSRVKPPSEQPADVAPIARQVADLLRFEAEARKVEISVDVPDALPPVMADSDQLRQVLVNLVMNACDACTSPGQVRLGAALDGSHVRIEVADSGCGIPAENVNRIFDPFFTTKKRGKGTGLGLSIAMQIVRNHGGTVEVASEVGRGTRFWVCWPVARGTEIKEANLAGKQS